MFKGWKHSVICTKCKGIHFVDKANMEEALDIALNMEETKKSDCCKAPYEYIGLRPEKEHILVTPVFDEPDTSIEVEEGTKEYRNHSVETFTPVAKPIEKPVEVETVVEAKEETQAKDFNVSLEDIVDVHRRMSGRYMTDVVRGVLEEDNEQTSDKLALLKAEHPSFFQDALKYVPKFLKSKYKLA